MNTSLAIGWINDRIDNLHENEKKHTFWHSHCRPWYEIQILSSPAETKCCSWCVSCCFFIALAMRLGWLTEEESVFFLLKLDLKSHKQLLCPAIYLMAGCKMDTKHQQQKKALRNFDARCIVSYFFRLFNLFISLAFNQTHSLWIFIRITDSVCRSNSRSHQKLGKNSFCITTKLTRKKKETTESLLSSDANLFHLTRFLLQCK